MESNEVIGYIDGACSGNPGPGGWGVYLQFGKHEKELNGYEAQTTNNRMEIQAAIEALRSLRRKVKITLITDSTYLKRGVEEWLETWKNNNWRTKQKRPVKNKELWLELDKLVELYNPKWAWVKGHSGNPGNERADKLARLAIENNR